MTRYTNAINNQFLDIAVLGNLTKTLTAQVAISPAIGPENSVVSGLLVNPVYSLSSGTLFGEQITPFFNPEVGNTYAASYGLLISPTITATGVGTITNLFGLNIAGPVISANTLTNSYSLFVSSSSGTVTNNYTAILGDTNTRPLIGIGTLTPSYLLDVDDTINTYHLFTGGRTNDNQLVWLTEGYNQGGLGGGIPGTNKTMSQNTVSYFDTAQLNSASNGFYGNVFDGRFVYFVPNDGNASGLITRYDTVISFSNPLSYTCFDTTILSPGSTGFRGGVFDGTYVYLVPGAGTITRYDTTSSFLASFSYTCFDLQQVIGCGIGFQGGVFDGRYVYYVPSDAGAQFHGTIVRYDTTASFTIADSYTSFDTRRLSSGCVGFLGGVYDGRYVYYVPYQSNSGFSGTIVQYDTTLSFTALGSYTTFDLTQISPDCAGYRGAVFDGRFIYFAPYRNNSSFFGRVARFDTLFSFTSVNSYTTYDTTVLSSTSKGFFGAIFDGRYVYFVPSSDGISGYSGSVTRFDTILPFTSSNSYQIFDLAAGNSNSRGFIGAVYDGRYIYFAPNNNNSSGLISRMDAYPGALATSMAANQAPNGFAIGSYVDPSYPEPQTGNLIVSGFVGVNTSNPQYELDVNGTINATVTVIVDIQNEKLGSTADNQHIAVAQGYNQGGFGAGSVGTSKQLSANTINYFDMAANVNPNLIGFFGAVFDGRYIYFVPNFVNEYAYTVGRYDTSQSYFSSGSYTTFDLSTISTFSRGFSGGLYDGRYIYFLGNTAQLSPSIRNGTITRYDTTLSFVAPSSYTTFNTTQLNPNCEGYNGSSFSVVPISVVDILENRFARGGAGFKVFSNKYNHKNLIDYDKIY